MNQDRAFCLEDFAGGAVAERLAVAIGQIYENIADPNREADKARKLTIELTFKPAKNDRTDVAVTAIVKTSLQPQKSVTSRMIIEGDGSGNVFGAEWNRSAMRGQMEIEQTETAGASGVIDLQAQKRKVESV